MKMFGYKSEDLMQELKDNQEKDLIEKLRKEQEQKLKDNQEKDIEMREKMRKTLE